MAAELTNLHGKTQARIHEPALRSLTKSVHSLSTSVHDAQQQGSRIEDEDLSEMFAEINVSPGEPAPEEAVDLVQAWATIEDDDDVVEAFRQDAADEMTAQLAGTHLSTCREEESEDEADSDHEDTGGGRRAPPAYGELSSHFGVLEVAARESGNGDAAFHLSKAKMAMIAAHAAKGVRQTDMREFVDE